MSMNTIMNTISVISEESRREDWGWVANIWDATCADDDASITMAVRHLRSNCRGYIPGAMFQV